MIDYSKMSDFEINCRVHAEVMGISGLDSFKAKDYCNNPSDAWPIIVENKIWLREMYGIWDSIGFPDERHPFSQVGWKDKNPLRAAMITFLMMQGKKIG